MRLQGGGEVGQRLIQPVHCGSRPSGDSFELGAPGKAPGLGIEPDDLGAAAYRAINAVSYAR